MFKSLQTILESKSPIIIIFIIIINIDDCGHRRNRGDMIEVYKILTGKYDPTLPSIQCCCQYLFLGLETNKTWPSGLETETETWTKWTRVYSSLETMVSRSQHWLYQFQLVIEHSLKGATNYSNRAIGRHQACCLETKTETLAMKSRDRDRDLDKMNSSALESRDYGLEITTLSILHRNINSTTRGKLATHWNCAHIVRVGSITFKMYFNYKIQITFLKSNSNTFFNYFGYDGQNTKYISWN